VPNARPQPQYPPRRVRAIEEDGRDTTLRHRTTSWTLATLTRIGSLRGIQMCILSGAVSIPWFPYPELRYSSCANTQVSSSPALPKLAPRSLPLRLQVPVHTPRMYAAAFAHPPQAVLLPAYSYSLPHVVPNPVLLTDSDSLSILGSLLTLSVWTYPGWGQNQWLTGTKPKKMSLYYRSACFSCGLSPLIQITRSRNFANTLT